MNIYKIIENNKQYLQKYKYYRSLGYADYAAAVFSTVTYGEEEVVFLAKELGVDTSMLIPNLFSWLQERKEEMPEDAVREFFEGKSCKNETPDTKLRAHTFFSFPPQTDGISEITSNLEVECDESPLSFPESDDEVHNETECFVMNFAEEESESDEVGEFSLDYELPSVLGQLREALSTDSYATIEEKAAKGVFTSPTSTFRMTTSNASVGIIFNQIRNGRRVYLDQVRIEEVLNYFDYSAKAPENEMFRISTELLPKENNKKLLYIHAQAVEENKDHQNIVLLLDVSGSMSSNEEVTQEAIATVFSKLRIGDKISLVTYSSEDRTVFEGYEIRSEQDKESLMAIVYGLEIEGCTYGSAGIETAYAIGARHYHSGWNNQVILITDGDLNFGITSKNGLEEMIEEKKKSNLFLSVIGTGLYNYKDDNLEVLAKHGNGTYCVINSLADVEDTINKHYTALMNIVAKDVKAQVEFNPRFVKTHRLLGYENRNLSHEDFINDAVISEPYGSGSHGVALYELEIAEEEHYMLSCDLKYQIPVLIDSDELGTVKIRYKEPSSEISHSVEAAVYNIDNATDNARLAYLLYCISEKLRGSDKLDKEDERYLNDMITSCKYKTIAGTNLEKLELLIDALKHNAEREPEEWIDFDFLW